MANLKKRQKMEQNLRRLAGMVKNTKNPLDPARYTKTLGVGTATARKYFKALAEQGVVRPVKVHPGNRRGRPNVFYQNAAVVQQDGGE